MKHDIFVENDPSKSCRSYPNEEFENYNDCDKDFVSKTLAKHFGPNLIPIWATFDLGKVTRSHFVDWSYDYRVLFDGTRKSDCRLPCSTTSVNIEFLGRKEV